MLGENGQPPKDIRSKEEVMKCLSINDIFQGYIGDCFLIAVILGVSMNPHLLAHIIPIDNAEETNKRLGVYHFRLWNMGDWYDVVVDDVLPVYDGGVSLAFARNSTHLNELWVPLLEKAIVK